MVVAALVVEIAKTHLHETLKPGDLMMVVGLLAVFPTVLALLILQYCHAQCLPFLIFHFFLDFVWR